ncbi:translocation/assembly module TamB domain-containing protein [Deinococcus cavernae]|uniref:translocation/assembly module TamB domain-containing protein n=1 Tax=Deinococcus cavernae TaxID=2320857 RepID=UPI0011C21E8A|nr:translocation/assembly module TamB domain-containing protein [Deinococcus cavernae]
MTRPGSPELTPPPSPAPRRRKAHKWPWVLLGAGLALGAVVAYSPALFGNQILGRLGEQVGVKGGRVSGPLWSPTLSDAAIDLPGLTATAGRANVTVVSANPLTRTARINVSVNDATVNLKLKELMSGTGQPAGGGGGGWKIIVDQVNVQNTRLNVDGQGANIPSVTARISRDASGKILLHGRTPEGPLSAQVQVADTAAGANRFTVHFDADARIARDYWKGIEAGWLRGQYVFGDGPIQGDVKLYRGLLRVPEAQFVTVKNVTGTALHRGDHVTLNLAGTGWDGPVTAKGGVDLKAQNWTVSADATPTVAGLARSLNTTGQGNLKLRVTAGGWSTIRVKAYAQGAGTLAGVPFSNAKAEYTLLNNDTHRTPQTNDLSFSADTGLSGSQRLEGQWAFGRKGSATWKGDFAGKPLDIAASMNDANVVALRGRGLGGPLAATFDLEGQQLAATFRPAFAAAKADITLTGTPENLTAVVKNGAAGPFPLSGTARLTKTGVTADFGTVQLNLDKQFRGTWQARNLTGAGVTLSGRGRLDATGGDVTGDVQAKVPGIPQAISGPLNLNYIDQRGTFRPGEQVLTWQGDQFGLKVKGLAVAGGARLSGNLRVDNRLNAFGNLRVLGSGYDLNATALGQSARVRGTAAGIPVQADAQLQAPYLTTVSIPGTDVRGVLSVNERVNFTLSTRRDTLRGALDGERVNVNGRVNLAALAPVLPTKNLSGLVEISAVRTGANTRLNVQTVRPVQLDVGGPAVNVGHLGVNLDGNLRGTWQVRGLTGAGAAASGAGRLDLNSGNLAGNVQADVPGIARRLSGPLSLNFRENRGEFRPSGQVLSWQGQNVRVQANDLPLSVGARVSGDVRVDSQLNAFGTLRASGNGYNLTAQARGDQASLRGTAGGVSVVADTFLKAPYRTTARLEGTDIRAAISVQNGVRFTVSTLGDTASGVLNGPNLNASGRVNLAALRPLLPLKDLGGTLDLNLAGQGGTARVSVLTSGANVSGTLTRAAGADPFGRVLANLTATLPDVNGARPTARLSGQVYPEVQAGGTVTYQNQKLNLAVNGPYGSLAARVTGRTGPLAFGGVSVPAQAVNIRAALTPSLSASGTWGNLRATYDGKTGLTRVAGRQALTAFGQSGQVQGRATWGPGFRGAVDVRGVLDQYTIAASGPWSRLNVLLTDGRGLRGTGTASLPGGRYDIEVNGPLTIPGQERLIVSGKVQGTGANPRGTVLLRDPRGGQARVTLNGFDNLNVTAERLTLAGQTLDGTLSAQKGLLTGTLKAGPLTVVAANGRLRATGNFAGNDVVASGRLILPATVSDLNVRVSGPYLTAQASGSAANLRGQVNLKAQRFGSSELGVIVPAQTLPLSASLTGARANIAGLVYQGGQWRGRAALAYALQTQAAGKQVGRLTLVGGGNTLAALPSGPLEGRVQVLPALGGTLSARLAPFIGVLPENLRAYVQPGRLVAQVRATGAELTLQQTRYLQEPLGLNAHVDWRSVNGRRGVEVQGALTHPGSRLPVQFDGKNLSVRGATLDARALRPLIGGASGRVNLDLNVPELKFGRATGQAGVNIALQGQRAVGRVTLRGGQLAANLSSTLQGYDVRLLGPIYPRANATLQVVGGTGTRVNATLQGDAAQTIRLRAQGTVQNQPLNVTAWANGLTGLTGNTSSVKAVGSFAGAALDIALNRSGGAGLAAWKASGTLNVPDLRPLANTAGRVNAVLGGTLANLNLLASGEAAGVNFSAPARFQNGVLSVRDAQANLAQGNVTASGNLFPTLALKARADVRDVLPGQYTAQVTGTFSRPDVSVTGKLSRAVNGLDVAGTTLNARLLGKIWKAEFTGSKVSGSVRGQLDSGAVAGLQNASLNLNTRYASGENDVRLRGPLGWNARSGWLGNLRVTGDVPGGPLDAIFTGQGPLTATGTLGIGEKQAGFNAVLPANLPLKPAGSITVTRLDAGAFWGRAGQLQASGTATLGGPAWNRVEATFAGQLTDRAGELSGQLNARYAAANVDATLNGPQVTGSATLRNGRYDATLKSAPLHLARLLPESTGVADLTFAGTVQARGSAAGGPERLTLQNVELKGTQAQAGPFSLYGSAEYQPRGELLKANLRGSLRGGLISAVGELPAGLNVQVNGVPTNYPGAASFGTGKADGTVTLTGQASDPFLSGNLNVLTGDLAARLTVSGRGRDPQLSARATLNGGTTGTLYAEASTFDFQKGTARTKVYGTVRRAQNVADVNLSGVWPDLSGTVQAKVDGLASPVRLTGDGRGGYALNAGTLGRGNLQLTRTATLIPKLSGSLNLNPLTLVDGSKGQADVAVTLGGLLNAPTVAGSVTTVGAEVAGVTLLDTTGTVTGTLQNLTGTLRQGTQTVGTLNGRTLTLTDFGVKAAGSTLRASGTANLNGAADLALTSVGAVQGTLKVDYREALLKASGNVATQGFTGSVNVQASQKTGWNGTARVTGGPNGLLTQPAELKVSGPLAQPLLTGQAGVLGAQARIVASQKLVNIRLVDGPGATASGAVQLQPDAAGEWRWSGATSLTRPELSLSLTPSGPLADPQVVLSVRRGEWRASGTASRENADLNVSDGTASGRVTWKMDAAGQSGQLGVNLPGLNLGTLDVKGLNGIVTANGALNTRAQNGTLAFTVKGFTTPQEVPVVGLQPAGDITGQASLAAGVPKLQATANLNVGTLNLNATQVKVNGENRWAGTLGGTLRKDQGSVLVNLNADTNGLRGQVSATNYVLSVSGQSTTVNGTLTLNGQTFNASGRLGNGRGTLTASGGIADALPALQNIVAVIPTGDGYTARAVLNDLDIERLNVAPGLSGRVSGEANLNDGGGTFFLQSNALKLGPKTLPARIEGTQATGSWRLRGFLGETEFTAGLDARSEVFGQANLRALPLGALVGALTDTNPGEGIVTGLARFRFPLADPAAGSVNVVAERIRVSTVPVETVTVETANTPASGTSATTPTPPVTETLTGTGTLDYANRELRNVNVQLSGAGTWDVRGQYTRQKVDLNAVFTGTTFTPVLRLVPGLAGLEPSLKGTVRLSAAGTYDQPRGLLRAENVQGSLAGLSVQVPLFAGELPDSGAFTAGGRILTGGTVATDGTLDLSGQLTLGKLSGTRLKFSGLLAPEALGALPNTTATIEQNGEAWTLSAQSVSRNPVTGAGALTLSGTLTPRLDLNLNAQNYNLPLAAVYAKESALTGTLRAVDDGQFIHVSGAADFARLTLGRVNAPSTIPAPQNGAVSGQLDTPINNFNSPLPEQFTTFPTPGEPADAARRTLPLLERLLLEDIRLTAPSGIRVDENLARAEFGTQGLTISGTGARPRIEGKIESQRGSIFLRENEFQITEGNVTFAGDGVYPTFRILAQGTVPSSTTQQRVPITLKVEGDFRTVGGRPNVLYLNTALTCAGTTDQSCVNPSTGNAYNEAELYALVATGVPNLASLPDNLTALGSSALQTALNVFVLGEVERTLARALGVDVFRLTPTLATDGTLNATFTVGSYLTRNLFLQYQVDLTGAGLINATYTTPDGRFTLKASTPLTGLDIQSIRPSFSAAYNVKQASFSVGVTTNPTSTQFNFGVSYRLP